ncbi:MAG: hypothetical protein RLN90_13505 [Balneolaceae bacterium]
MNITKYIRKTTLIAGLALIGFACSDSNNNSDSATISGKTTSNNQKAFNTNAKVASAGYITSNGTIQTIDGTEVNTDVSGKFDVVVNADAYQNIVVQAKSETETTMGFVATKIENGNSYTIKPIDTESSAETKVFAGLVASGNSAMINKSEIETVITSTNAASVNSSSFISNNIATALDNSAKVRAEYFNNEFAGEANAKMEAVASAMVDAQTRLEAQLNTATSIEAREEAYATFRSDFTNAYLNAEMKASTAAKAVEMWGRVFINSTSSTSSEVKSEMNIQVSLVTAAIIDAAVQAEMEAAGAAQSSRNAVVQAGVNLRSEISASAGVMAEIRTAFENYNEEVKTTLEKDSNFSATAIIAVDSEINSASGAKATFDNSIATRISANLVLQVYNSFYSSIQSSVESNFDSNSADIEAVTELMILINTAS